MVLREQTDSQNENLENPLGALNDIVTDVSENIDSGLQLLEQNINQLKDDLLSSEMVATIAQIPIIGQIFSDVLADLNGSNTEIDSEQLQTRFHESAVNLGVELTPQQSEIFSWTAEARDFWNQHLPQGVPSMPPSVLAIMMSTFQIESRFNTQAANPHSSAAGLAQFLSGTWNGYKESTGPTLVENGICSQAELNAPNARTANPRLMIYMTYSYMIKSYQVLARNNLVQQGWDTPDLAYMLYVCHHHGAGDGPKYLRYRASNDPQEVARIRASMVNTWDGWTYGERMRTASNQWKNRLLSPEDENTAIT